MRFRVALLVVVVLLGCRGPRAPRSAGNGASPSALWVGLRMGAHGVGYRSDTVAVADDEITSVNDRPSLVLSVWYPATRITGDALRFVDYFAEALASSEADTALALELARRVTPDSSTWARPVWTSILQTRMAARLRAEPARSTFPLVLWSARHETVAAQSVLSEFLASHGFIVVNVQRAGARLPYPFEIPDPRRRPPILASHLADLDFALSVMTRFDAVDSSRIAVLSWSYGGESASMLQRRLPQIDAVVGLSANVLDGWVYQRRDSLPQSDDRALTVPYILISETVAPDGTTRMDPPALDSLSAPSAVVRLDDLAHGNFNVIEGLIAGLVPELTAVQPYSRGGPVAAAGYRHIAEYTLAFLEQVLNGAGTLSEPASVGSPARIRIRPGGG